MGVEQRIEQRCSVTVKLRLCSDGAASEVHIERAQGAEPYLLWEDGVGGQVVKRTLQKRHKGRWALKNGWCSHGWIWVGVHMEG